MPPSPPTLADGRYELVRRIGRGASGEVWLAEDRRLGRQVAIKRADIPDYLGAAEQERIRRRLEREARAAARLRQPGVAQLFDIHVSEDGVDLVMAYVDAPTLHQLVADHGPMEDAEVAAIGLTIVDVLDEAHAQGVVHRDIKPSNVLVGDDGVRVTDFGIAAILDETALTRTGMALGSPSYIAPEQAQGEEPSPEADLWGLGATLYYALSGRPPFDRQRALATVHAVVHEPHQPLDPSHPLAGIVDRLLAKDPAARPATAEVRAALEEVAAGPADAEPDAPAPVAGTRVLPTADATADVTADATADETVATRPAGTTTDPSWARRLGIAAVLLLAGVAGVLWLTGGDPGTTFDVAGDEAPADGGPTTTTDEGPTAVGDGTDDDRGAERPATDDAGTTAPTREASDDATTEDPTRDGSAEAPEADGAATVPDGWEVHDGATYAVAHPPGWQVRDASGVRVDLVEPGTGAYLRIDWTDEPQPDPVADWESKSDGFATRHDDYREIRIEEVDYHDAAALWEYTYRDGGALLHAYNLGFVAEGRGYALNLQARADDWERVEPLFDDIMRSFRPAG